MRQKQHIGKTTSVKEIVVENGTIDRFVEALNIEDPLVVNARAAKAAGLTGRLLPPIGAASLGDFESATALLEVKPKQVLHSKDTVTVFEPLCVGDVITVSTTIKNVFEQQVGGNPMGFAEIEVLGTGKRKAVLFEAERVLAIRGGFSRR